MSYQVSPSPDPTVFWLPSSTWDVLGTIVQIAAVIVGGIWVYIKFIRQREGFPKASVTHRIVHIDLPAGQKLLRSATLIANTGGVILRILEATFRVQQVLPLQGDALRKIEKGEDPVANGYLDVNWGGLSERTAVWKEGDFEIEPGESDQVTADFVIPANVSMIQVYSHFKNSAKPEQDIGWEMTTFYDFGGAHAEPLERTVEDLTGRERGGEPKT